MKKFIYVSDLKFGPDATKKQSFLFRADLEFAISEGYEYIQPKDGPVFKIVNNNELVEVEVTEEELQAQATVNPARVEFDQNLESEVFKSKYELTGNIELDEPFFEDVKKCFNQGIGFIEDSEGFLYRILEENVVENVVEHFYLPDDESDDKDSICLHCENKELIMNHINKVLQADEVSEMDIDAMLKLAHLAKILDGVE